MDFPSRRNGGYRSFLLLQLFCNAATFFLLEGGEHKNVIALRRPSMTGTLSPAMNATAQGFSVTYSYFPPQPRCTETPPLAVLHSPASSAPEEYLFLRQGDYWVIRYQGQVAFLKTSRGLQCLSLLLHHPGREFHVSELLGLVLGKPAVSASPSQVRGLSQSTSDAGPILDGQAKAE